MSKFIYEALETRSRLDKVIASQGCKAHTNVQKYNANKEGLTKVLTMTRKIVQTRMFLTLMALHLCIDRYRYLSM